MSDKKKQTKRAASKSKRKSEEKQYEEPSLPFLQAALRAATEDEYPPREASVDYVFFASRYRAWVWVSFPKLDDWTTVALYQRGEGWTHSPDDTYSPIHLEFRNVARQCFYDIGHSSFVTDEDRLAVLKRHGDS